MQRHFEVLLHAHHIDSWQFEFIVHGNAFGVCLTRTATIILPKSTLLSAWALPSFPTSSTTIFRALPIEPAGELDMDCKPAALPSDPCEPVLGTTLFITGGGGYAKGDEPGVPPCRLDASALGVAGGLGMACGEMHAHRGDAACRDPESPALLNFEAFGTRGMRQVVRSTSNDALCCNYTTRLV